MAVLLIVDDDTEQLRIRELVLAAAGHDIRTAACVADAVRLMAEIRARRVIDGSSAARASRTASP